MPKAYKRGYPVALLVGIEKDHAVVWQIFSHVAKNQQTIRLNASRNDEKALYSFHESIVNALRPTLKEGIRSIIVASPPKTNYATEFQNHIKYHHSWLNSGINKATFSSIEGSASTPSKVAELSKRIMFKKSIGETTSEETESLVEILNQRLNDQENLVFFSLQEAENLIIAQRLNAKTMPDYLLLTNSYLQNSHQKNRIQRLLQIAKNKQVKTRVINSETAAGKRLMQLGGIVCLVRPK